MHKNASASLLGKAGKARGTERPGAPTMSRPTRLGATGFIESKVAF